MQAVEIFVKRHLVIAVEGEHAACVIAQSRAQIEAGAPRRVGVLSGSACLVAPTPAGGDLAEQIERAPERIMSPQMRYELGAKAIAALARVVEAQGGAGKDLRSMLSG